MERAYRITTLYETYLGWPTKPLAQAWSNRYRIGDYIGGVISHNKVDNKSIWPGGHTFYWQEEEVAQLLLSQVE